ncbi:lipoprotein insertase outer membrane protein LolB [Limnohabitans sp. 2KL-27]|uniref:lipoprotein insertase outer membrane protein LolB n=1 Tax=Limnohabitans sp. 2KL-27 TaxID=1100705 RepID=UPI000A628E20|nr:outer membrane lipoprotein LolB [Limnohabitans sp. 2KL-27]
MTFAQQPRSSPLERRAWLGLLSMGLLSLAGCATPRPRPADPAAFWSGRLALQLQSNPPQNWSASFELQGSAEQGQLVLLSPIGTTFARLSWTPQAALLEQGQDKTEGSSLQSLSQRLTGTDLPIAALFEWLAGKALDAPGWQVDLSAHPQGRLTARKMAPGPEAVLRILLDR